MSKKRTAVTNGNQTAVSKSGGPPPRSLALASKGVRTGSDFAGLMSALMTDLIEGSITPSVGNATCNAGGKLLKVVEMSYKYGTQSPKTNIRVLELTTGDEPAPL